MADWKRGFGKDPNGSLVVGGIGWEKFCEIGG
jgi:hypothetical protein